MNPGKGKARARNRKCGGKEADFGIEKLPQPIWGTMERTNGAKEYKGEKELPSAGDIHEPRITSQESWEGSLLTMKEFAIRLSKTEREGTTTVIPVNSNQEVQEVTQLVMSGADDVGAPPLQVSDIMPVMAVGPGAVEQHGH